jgi:hypothetical protein
MEKAEVPAGRIYSVADIAADPHYAAREMIVDTIAGDGEPLKQPGVAPKLSATPGAIRSPAPRLGEHTADEVLEGRAWDFPKMKFSSLKKAHGTTCRTKDRNGTNRFFHAAGASRRAWALDSASLQQCPGAVETG